MRWFTSDLHLGHKNIIEYCSRPFRTLDGQPDAAAMTEQFVKNFREVMKPGDELYVLGDLAFDVTEARSFLRAIPGQKHIVWGNHDPKKERERDQLADTVQTMRDIREVTLKNGTKAVLCHYPMLRWNKGHFGSYMLHGHTHGELQYPDVLMRIMDVGVDTGDPFHRRYYPWSEDEIIERMDNRRAFEHHYYRET